MMKRSYLKQPNHDNAVRAVREIYQSHNMYAWINPDGEKNRELFGYYIDVIAVQNQYATLAWVIEIETEDSVNETEALNQWKEYDQAYTNWYLAVPVVSKSEAERLVWKYGFSHCEIVTWTVDGDGAYLFWGLPGLK